MRPSKDQAVLAAVRTQRYVAVAGAAVMVALSAQISVPVWGSPVPQSLQTLAVLVVGGVLGARLGAAAVLLYLAMGAAGLPVFADGAAGHRHLVGPTSGYLVGFACAAAVVGYVTTRPRRIRLLELVAVMVLGHIIILTLGWARLAFTIGASGALMNGVAPFIWGGLVKSIAATAIIAVYRRWFGSRPVETSSNP